MAKKAKAKEQSFRQRLRQAAEAQLNGVSLKVKLAVGDIAIENGLKPEDLAKLVSGSQIKTLREGMVTTLANLKEAELEAIYNKQMDLLPGEADANEEKA